MQKSKLVFSEAELQMASDPEIILTKNRIIESVYTQFGTIGNLLFDSLKDLGPQFSDELSVLPKISRGENYGAMPWVMLDYPRYFHKEKGHLALRIFFWWGNYFLVQWQLSGKYLHPFQKLISQSGLPGIKYNLIAWAGYPSDPYDFRLPQPGMELADSFKMQQGLKDDTIFKYMVKLPFNQAMQLEELCLQMAEMYKAACKPG